MKTIDGITTFFCLERLENSPSVGMILSQNIKHRSELNTTRFTSSRRLIEENRRHHHVFLLTTPRELSLHRYDTTNYTAIIFLELNTIRSEYRAPLEAILRRHQTILPLLSPTKKAAKLSQSLAAQVRHYHKDSKHSSQTEHNQTYISTATAIQRQI